MALTGAMYMMDSGSRGVMDMCVREMIRNDPKSMLILTVDDLPHLKKLPRGSAQR